MNVDDYKNYPKTQIATWSLPKGLSADTSQLVTNRMQHYRFLTKHFLIDGTRIIPTIPTIRNIFDAYEQFNMQIAISANSFTYYNEHDFNNVPQVLIE